MYATEGLRVLVMAKRILSDEEYKEWLELHRDAEVCAVVIRYLRPEFKFPAKLCFFSFYAVRS